MTEYRGPALADASQTRVRFCPSPTGTPAGTTVLHEGNEVEVEVEGIGALVTRIRS